MDQVVGEVVHKTSDLCVMPIAKNIKLINRLSEKNSVSKTQAFISLNEFPKKGSFPRQKLPKLDAAEIKKVKSEMEEK